jgi:hypothetical protein
MAMTASVGAGSSAPKPANTPLNDGTTKTISTTVTRKATVSTEIG